MVTLAIDTTAPPARLALSPFEGGDPSLFEAPFDAKARPADHLGVLLEAAFACVNAKDIERIVVAVGPGTFTGLRCAVAVARGLALSLQKPAVGVTGFALLAAEMRAIHGASACFGIAFGSAARPIWQIFSSQTESDLYFTTPSWSEAPFWAGPLAAQKAGTETLTQACIGPERASMQTLLTLLGALEPLGARPAPFYGRPVETLPSSQRPALRLDVP